MSAAEILKACLETGTEAAWTNFVRRFQPLIAASISRVLRRHGKPSPALVDDLVQETYLRLCRDNCRSLREFQIRHDEAIFGYLKVVATSVTLDYFRARATHKRRDEIPDDGGYHEVIVSSSAIEDSALFCQLDQHLSSSESDRDRSIFWLYYRQGYTAKDIAALPAIGLGLKGVESCIHRLTQTLRGLVSGKKEGSSKGRTRQPTLGDMT